MVTFSVCSLKDVAKRKLLRNGARYVSFWKLTDGNIFGSEKTIRLRDCVKFASSKVIKKDDQLDQEYQLIDLANIEPGFGSFINLEQNIVSEIGSDKVYISDSDLVFSKLNSHIGYVFLTSELPNSEYPTIGSTEFFPLNVNKEKIHPKILKYLLLHEVFRKFAGFLRAGKSQSHPRIQKDDFFNLKIPVLDKNVQAELLNVIAKYELLINSIRREIQSLQEIINEVLQQNKIPPKGEELLTNTRLVTKLSNLAQHKALRLGAKYNDLWDSYNGELFEKNTAFPIKPIKQFVRIDRRSNLKKGILDKPYILIDFDQVQSLDGVITDFENEVSEIGSDKVLFNDCDLLTNKLRPYLGYTILNRANLDLIGTTEFIPLMITDKELLNPKYLRYLLLSDSYLFKSHFLSSGKEHPRISPIDLLNIKIPIPSKTIQEKIVMEIEQKEEVNLKDKIRYSKARNELDSKISDLIRDNNI